MQAPLDGFDSEGQTPPARGAQYGVVPDPQLFPPPPPPPPPPEGGPHIPFPFGGCGTWPGGQQTVTVLGPQVGPIGTQALPAAFSVDPEQQPPGLDRHTVLGGSTQ